MDKKYFVLDFKKIKSVEDYKNIVVGHNARLHRRKRHNVDPSRTKDNITLQELKYKTAKELIEYGNSNLKGKSRKLKRGSAFAFNVVVDCSPDSSWTQEDYINYLKDAYNFLVEHFKGQEVVYATIHMDETKPHLHVTFSYFNEKLGKWNQRGLMEQKKTDLNKLLDEFERKVAKKYGLYRGDGKKLQKVKKELQKNIKTISVEKRKFFFFKEVKNYKVLSPKNVVDIINKYSGKLLDSVDKKELQDKLSVALQQNKKFQKQIREMEQERQKFLRIIEQVKELEQELAEQKQVNKQLARELVETKAKLSKTPQQAKNILKRQVEQKYNIYIK